MVSTKLRYTGLPTINSFLKRITESQIFDNVPTIQAVESAGPLIRNSVTSKYNFLTITPIGRGAGNYRARFDFSYKSGTTLPVGTGTKHNDFFGIAFMNRPGDVASGLGIKIAGVIGFIDSTTNVNLSSFSYYPDIISMSGNGLTIPALAADGNKHSLDMFLDINVTNKVVGNDMLYAYGCDAFFKFDGLKKTNAFTIMDDGLSPNLTGFAFCGSLSESANTDRYNLRGLEISYTATASPLSSLLEDL